jgi:ATP-dependent DNA helicase PIF1
METNSKAKIFIWDEAPMLEKYCFETVDRTFRDLMKNIDPKLANIPFGGKAMVFGGDFRQTLPVVRHGNRSAVVSRCFNRSYLWKHMRIYNFTINKRLEQSSETNTKEKHQFNKYLLDIGEGNEKSFKSKNGDEVIKLPDDICMDFTKP